MANRNAVAATKTDGFKKNRGFGLESQQATSAPTANPSSASVFAALLAVRLAIHAYPSGGAQDALNLAMLNTKTSTGGWQGRKCVSSPHSGRF